MFKHALTHEVAYDAQAETERRVAARPHRRSRRAGVRRPPAGALRRAGAPLHRRRSDGTRRSSTCWPRRQQAERTFATREALALYDDALRAAERLAGGVGDPATLIGIHEAKARLYFVTSDFERSAAEGERILPLARLTGNRIKEAEALATIAWASTWGRNLDAAIRVSREAIAVAEPAGALAVQGRAHFTIGFVRGVTGVLDESHAALDKAIAISTAAGDAVQSVAVAVDRRACCETGPATTARRASPGPKAWRWRASAALLFPLLFSCFLRGLTLTGKGDYDEAFASFTEGLSLAERVGDEAIHHRLLNCLGWLYADLGDLDHAEELNAIERADRPPSRDPGDAAERRAQSRRDLPGEGRSGARAGSVRRCLPVLEESVDEPVDAIPVFDPDVRRHGRAGGGARRSCARRDRTAPSASSWRPAPTRERIW